jgi:ribose transport system ATP-binding protein
MSTVSRTDTVPLLAMTGISKRFGGVVALDNVSLSIGRAEILALIGENGAGKSTLMKTLGGVHQPDTGEIKVDGNPVRIRSVRDADQQGIGFIHQELNLLDNLDVAANLFLGREPTKGGPLRLLDRAKMEADSEVYLKRLGLDVPPNTPVSHLSLAQRQLVEIARALSQNARLLIMDEPTSSLTLTETQRLLALIHDLRDNQGVSIIYISHRLGEIREIADRVVGLRDGKNAGNLDEKEQITQEAMVRLMVGRDITPPDRRDISALADTPPRLLVRDLRTARHPNKTISFELRPGEILGFAGLIGAGRTEVAEALFGVHPAVSGTVTLDGTPITIRTPADGIRNGIYLIPEDRRHNGLILDMPIRENISLPSLNRFATAIGLIKSGEERASTRESTKRLNVKSALGRQADAVASDAPLEANASTLSGGNQQKVVLAKWVDMAPKVLLFDEPTRGVDVGAKAEIYALIRALAESGVAVMVISSDMEEVLGLSDRVAVMHEGTLTGILSGDEASEEAVMRLAVGQAGAAALL